MRGRSVPVILLLIFAFSLSCFICLHRVAAVEGDSWETLVDMPTERSGLGLAVVDGKIYAIGGRNEAGVLNVTEEYDPVTDEWTVKADMPTARSDFGIAVYQDRIYVIGGTTGYGDAVGEHLVTNVTEVYDPATNSWETKTSMPTPRENLEANIVNDKIYLIGGVAHKGYLLIIGFDDNEVYDPETDSWTTAASLPTSVWGYASAVVDNKVYVIGGGNKTYEGTFPVNLTQVYNPDTDTWTLQQEIPTGLWNTGAGATTGTAAPERIYVLGGSYYSSTYNLTQIYDPEVDVWTIGTPLPTPRRSLGVTVVDDRIYVIGGGTEEDSYSTVNERYTPAGWIPEFPSWMVLMVVLMVVSVASVFYKRKGEKKHR